MTVTDTMTKSNCGGKGLFHLVVYSPSWKAVRAGAQAATRRQGQKQRPWRGTAYWLASQVCSACFLVQSKAICSGLSSPTSVINQENAPLRHAHRSVQWRLFLNRNSLFLDYKKKQKTDNNNKKTNKQKPYGIHALPWSSIWQESCFVSLNRMSNQNTK